MYNLAVTYAVFLSVGILAYCIEKVRAMLRERIDEKTEQRREVNRRKAYKAVRERRVISDNRRELWENIQK